MLPEGTGEGSAHLSPTRKISLQMYAIHSSFSVLPFVFLIRSVTEPAPQNSITNWQEKETVMYYDHAWLPSLTKLGLESRHSLPSGLQFLNVSPALKMQ